MPGIEILYLICALLLALYGFNSLAYAWLYRRTSKRPVPDAPPAPAVGQEPGSQALLAPMVTVQLPIYNERHVVDRLLAAVVALDWPADRLHVQVLDDSEDDTGQIVRTALARYGHTGIHLSHVRRPQRDGCKAGALGNGLATAQGDFIAIFDADFVPDPTFLTRMMSTFRDPTVGCVQGRWGHINPDSSHLTRAQALGIDGHFVVEQSVRDRLGAFLNFNGTAGIWRRSCILAAGGWQSDTLTEDLDLSYRAQLSGWRVVYRPDVVVPAELPVQIDALKRQQFRWAKGSLQTAVKLSGTLWRSSQPFWRKVQGTLHLTNYAVHPLMMANLILVWPMLSSHHPLLTVTPYLIVAAAGPPLMYWTAMGPAKQHWLARLGRLIHLVMLGTGLSVNNTWAFAEAIFGVKSTFMRTPKFAATNDLDSAWQSSSYALPRSASAWLELVLALYSVGLLIFSLYLGVWWVVPWLVFYAGGYGYVAVLAFGQGRQRLAARALPLAIRPVEQ